MTNFLYYQQKELWTDIINTPHAVFLDELMSLIPADSATILDAACGNGAVANHLAATYDVTGCDISLEALHLVTRPKCVADLAQLPFADNAFDLVIATDVLEHIPENNYEQVCNELLRVSQRYLLIAVPFAELLDYATVACQHCAHTYHVHWHQRRYMMDTWLNYWQEKAGVVATRLCGGRWSWSSENLLTLRHQLLGRNYSFPNGVCPQCGTVLGHSNESHAFSLERDFESFHYQLAEAELTAWPQPSEIILLLDKQSVQINQIERPRYHEPPPTLPSTLALTQLAVFTDPIYYANTCYLTDVQSDSFTLVLPRLPVSITLGQTAEPPFIELYHFVYAKYYPIQGKTAANGEWVYALYPFSPGPKGYFLRIHSTIATIGSLQFGALFPTTDNVSTDFSATHMLDFHFKNQHILIDYTVATALTLTQSLNQLATAVISPTIQQQFIYPVVLIINNLLDILNHQSVQLPTYWSFQHNELRHQFTQALANQAAGFQQTLKNHVEALNERIKQQQQIIKKLSHALAEQAEQHQQERQQLQKTLIVESEQRSAQNADFKLQLTTLLATQNEQHTKIDQLMQSHALLEETLNHRTNALIKLEKQLQLLNAIHQQTRRNKLMSFMTAIYKIITFGFERKSAGKDTP